jgi:hypothetical protein
MLKLTARQQAKKAAAAKAGRDLTEQEIEEDEDDALLTTLAPGGEIEAREAHHTEAQIAVSILPKWSHARLTCITRPKKPPLQRPAEI